MFDVSRNVVDDAAHKHCLALSRISPNPHELAVCTTIPALEELVRKNPLIAFFNKTSLRVFYAVFIVSRIGCVEFLENLPGRVVC